MCETRQVEKSAAVKFEQLHRKVLGPTGQHPENSSHLAARSRALLYEAQEQLEDAAKETSQDPAIQVRERAADLEAANAALRVLIKAHENQRRMFEERIVCNINEMVRPYLIKLSASKLSQRQASLVSAIARGLDDIASPLSRRFIMESARLSPAESQVAGLIRQGRSTKEIARLIGVAVSTVDFHRLNIRRKLDLVGKRVNLQSYLKSLI